MVRFAAAALALVATLHGIAAYGAELVLLDFWSPTCGPCIQMKPTIEAFINAKYPIRQVDVSREQELARQYRVTGVPCFVMLVDGQEVAREVGAINSNQLQGMFERAKDVVRQQRGARGNSPDAPAPQVEQAQINAEDAAWARQFESKLLSCSVRLTLEDAKSRSHGTGTIIDAREGEALVITCGHLFRESKGQGPVSIELFESAPTGLRVVEKVQGTVVSYDLERDVAFVSIRPSHPVCVAPVAPPKTHVARGDRVASVGCSNGQDPTVMATRVSWLDRYQGPPNIEANGAPEVGRSGGGLFSDSGQLVGVCFAADYQGNKGLYAGLQSIHDELTRLGLQEIYAKPVAGSEPVFGGPAANGTVAGQETVVRGQEMPATMMQADVFGNTAPAVGAPTASAASAPANLPPNEQAALEEIVSRASTRNVVCIVQPAEPGGQVEVITLDNVSGEFVEALAKRQKGLAGTTR